MPVIIIALVDNVDEFKGYLHAFMPLFIYMYLYDMSTTL